MSGRVDDPRDFDAEWDYNDAAATFELFAARLPAARVDDNPAYLGELLSQIARTHSLRGEFEPAHAWLDEADSVVGAQPSVARVRCLLERGRTLNSAGERAKASTVFSAALELASQLGAEFYQVDAAHMLGISEPPAAALEWNVRAIEMAEQAVGERARKWRGSLYNNTGWSYFDLKQFDVALDYFERNLAFRVETGDNTSVARWSIAKAKRLLDEIEPALAIQRELLAENEASGTPDGFVFEELGECLLAAGDAAAAAPYFARAFDLLKEMHWVATSEPERLPRMAKLAGR